jgi:nucleoid-associated protein YgaU
MGFIDFVKDAGRKLLGVDDDAPKGKADRPKEKVTVSATVSPAQLDAKRAKAIEGLVRETGIAVDGLAVTVRAELATVRGKVATQAEKEKVALVVGNTLGIARVDDQLEVVKSEPAATFYTVKKGDTLSAIAKAHYGNGNKYPAIFEANRPMLSDPDKIYPGQVLRIPPLP